MHRGAEWAVGLAEDVFDSPSGRVGRGGSMAICAYTDDGEKPSVLNSFPENILFSYFRSIALKNVFDSIMLLAVVFRFQQASGRLR